MQYQFGEREKALNDIRTIINRYEQNNICICLWDPYLTANDIIETLFYSNIYNMQLKALGSYIGNSKKILDSKDFKEYSLKQSDTIRNSGNLYGINLEFRCQHDHFGFPFHDRFLIFFDSENKAEVWSLGTSINSIGKSHHLIQLVSHPQYVLEAFNKLWDKLNFEETIIYSSER